MWPSENYYRYSRENVSKSNDDFRQLMDVSRACNENLLNISSNGNISTVSYFEESNINISSECPTFWNDTKFVYNNGTEQSSAENLEKNVSLKLGLAVPMGIVMYMLSLVTVVGNAMVLHAIRTERRLQTVSISIIITLLSVFKVYIFVLIICVACIMCHATLQHSTAKKWEKMCIKKHWFEYFFFGSSKKKLFKQAVLLKIQVFVKWKEFKKFRLFALFCTENLVTIPLSTRCNISEDLDVHQHCWEQFKFFILFYSYKHLSQIKFHVKKAFNKL
jgi:hypothetical protein